MQTPVALLPHWWNGNYGELCNGSFDVVCTPDPPASGRGQGCPVPALALLAGGLTPAAAAPAASRQTRAPASTAVGHSQAPGGGERHAPSHARDTARCPYTADIPRSLDA